MPCINRSTIAKKKYDAKPNVNPIGKIYTKNNETKVFKNFHKAHKKVVQEKDWKNIAIVKKRNGFIIMYDCKQNTYLLYQPKWKIFNIDKCCSRITYLPKKEPTSTAVPNLVGFGVGAVVGYVTNTISGGGVLSGVFAAAAAAAAAVTTGVVNCVNTQNTIESVTTFQDERNETINTNDIIELLQQPQNKERFNELNKLTLNNLIKNFSKRNYENDKKIHYNSIERDWQNIIKNGLEAGYDNGIKQKNGDSYASSHWAKKMNPCTIPYIERVYKPSLLSNGIRTGQTELSLIDIDKLEFENMSIKELFSHLKSHIKIDKKWKQAFGSGSNYYLNEAKQVFKWMIITFQIILEEN
jgi:hypothetical protein